MADNEIIKALECCTQHQYNCPKDCPLYEYDNVPCDMNLMKNALDFVNRLKAQIEERKKDVDYWMVQVRMAREKEKTAKSEAYKEFAHMLIDKGKDGVIHTKDIPDYVKEMEGEWK